MKRALLSATVLITALTIYCCKKSSSSFTPAITSSQWSFNNITYKGDTTFLINNGSGYTLASEVGDTADNYAEIDFSTKPMTSGTFTVVSSTANPTATQCSIFFGKDSDGFISSGGGTVTITISNQKITAVFSNIPATDGSSTKSLSGTLIAAYN